MDSSNAVQLVAYGRPVGWLEYSTHRPLGTAELRLLGDLAHELGAALHAQAMRSDLQRARERRDLHDGIGPALAGLTLRVATVARILPDDADEAAQRRSGFRSSLARSAALSSMSDIWLRVCDRLPSMSSVLSPPVRRRSNGWPPANSA